MSSLPPAYRAVILDQQAQLQRLVKSAGVAPVRDLYDRMIADATSRLEASPTATFGHQQMSGILAQLKIGLARLQHSSGEAVGQAASTVGVHAARTPLTDAAKLEHHFTGAVISVPLLEAGRLAGLVRGEIPSLLRAHATSMARFGAQLVGRMEGELGQSLVLGESHAQAIDRVMQVGDLEAYRAERIVRTEMSYAASRSARAAADEQAEELGGDLWSRWTEHVSDAGLPLDERVGVDSEAMHGQVAPPGEMFTQPPTNRQGEPVGDSLVGQEWPCPPNRPNDRAVLVPWRAHWGVPGWRWEDGERVPVTETAAARTNAAWMRGRGLTPEVGAGVGQFGPGAGFAPAAAEEGEAAAAGEGDEEEPAPTQWDQPSSIIPTHADLAEAEETARPVVVDPQAVADHGWYEPAGYQHDLERAERAYQQVADRVEAPVAIGVTPRDNLVVEDAGDAARLNAAAHTDTPVPVRWERADRVPPGHVAKAGHDGEEPGLPGYSVPIGRILGAEDQPPAAPTAEVPHHRGFRQPERVLEPASPGPAEPEDLIARSKRLRRQLFGDQPRAPGWPARRPQEMSAEADAKRQDQERRARERYDRLHPPPAPPGYDRVEDFPGVPTYVSRATGERYTVTDVRNGTLDPPVTAADIPRMQARSRAVGFLAKIGRGIRALGRAFTGP